jgi:hypothetical protein
VFHDLAHAVFIISKISFSTKPTVISSFSKTASFQLWPTVFAVHGLEELFFQLCCCDRFFGCGRIFFLLAGNSFWCYLQT